MSVSLTAASTPGVVPPFEFSHVAMTVPASPHGPAKDARSAPHPSLAPLPPPSRAHQAPPGIRRAGRPGASKVARCLFPSPARVTFETPSSYLSPSLPSRLPLPSIPSGRGETGRPHRDGGGGLGGDPPRCAETSMRDFCAAPPIVHPPFILPTHLSSRLSTTRSSPDRDAEVNRLALLFAEQSVLACVVQPDAALSTHLETLGNRIRLLSLSRTK